MDGTVSWIFGMFVVGLMLPLAAMLGCLAIRKPRAQRTREPMEEYEEIVERRKWTAFHVAAACVAVFIALFCLPFTLGVLTGNVVLRSANRLSIALIRLRLRTAGSSTAAPVAAAQTQPAQLA